LGTYKKSFIRALLQYNSREITHFVCSIRGFGDIQTRTVARTRTSTLSAPGLHNGL